MLQLKIALRNLKKNGKFSLLNIFGLALSIGCCVLIFGIFHHQMSVDQFHEKLDRIAMIGVESKMEEVQKGGDVPYPMGDALRQEYAFLEKTAMFSRRENSLITIENAGQASAKFMEKTARAFAEPEFFEVFDFPLAQGSLKDFYEPYTAMLTEKMARKYFGSTDALGKSFKVNNRFEYRVVGVLKDLPENSDFKNSVFTSWSTLKADGGSQRMLANWGGIHGGTLCFALFREGHALAELENAFPAFREKYFHPEVREFFYHASPMKTAHFNMDYGFGGMDSKYLWALALIGLFLIGTACVNFINMSTAQALSRAREVGVRKSMGSTRAQLFWQFMAETGVIVAVSTGIGLLLARLFQPKLNAILGPDLAFSFSNWPMLGLFLAVLFLGVTFLAGAYPGLSLSRFQASESLKGSSGVSEKGGFSLRRALVGTQFAISQTLIIAAIVITSQMDFAQKADLGFQRAGIVTLPLPGGERSKKSALRQELGQIAGVENVSLSTQPPASESNWNTSVKLQSSPEYAQWSINLKFTDEKYLETYGLQVLAGRNLMPSDTARECILNEEAVKKLGFSRPEDILGKMIDVDNEVFPVVGVVKNFHNHSMREAIQPQVFTTLLGGYDVASVKISPQNLPATMAAVEKTWSKIYPDHVFESEFLDASIAKFYASDSVLLRLARIFAGIAIFVGCLGLYGLAAFMIVRKTKEIGIRKTLGASVAGLFWLFGKEYVRLIVLAFLVAAPVAWYFMNGWLNDYQFRIPFGAGIFIISLLATFGVAALTVGFQSVQAALADPVKSIRSE